MIYEQLPIPLIWNVWYLAKKRIYFYLDTWHLYLLLFIIFNNIPFSDYCDICLIPYNYVLHFENLEEEEKLLVDRLEAGQIIKPRRENVNTNKSPDIFTKYFSQLDQTDIDQLYRIYQTDFEIFNYKRELP